jgi:putative membrane protein
MMYWNDGWGWGAWLMMTVGMIGFWGLVAWVIVTLARGTSATRAPERSAEDILAERFARGEIDEEEYTARLDALHSRH